MKQQRIFNSSYPVNQAIGPISLEFPLGVTLCATYNVRQYIRINLLSNQWVCDFHTHYLEIAVINCWEETKCVRGTLTKFKFKNERQKSNCWINCRCCYVFVVDVFFWCLTKLWWVCFNGYFEITSANEYRQQRDVNIRNFSELEIKMLLSLFGRKI